jgi:fucose permease
VACASAQGELVSAYAGNAERAMARWTTFAAAGDVLAPLLVGLVLWQGGTYRAALLLVSALLVVQLVFTRHAEAGACPAPNEGSGPREALRAALSQPRLWLLLLGAEFCALLDEVVVALAALRMTRDLGASQALTAAALTAFSLGSLLGAALMDALLTRFSGRRLLLGSACASLAALGLVVGASSALAALAALLLLGASAAPHFALLQAAAYEAVPGRPGLVNAASQLLVGVQVVLPLCVGLLAARYGLGFALGALAVQPLFVLAAALFLLRRRD